jgi:hypothetical protein
MPNDLSGTSYEEFLKRQKEPKPPTANEYAWAKNNFSSRVDPPKPITPTDPS